MSSKVVAAKGTAKLTTSGKAVIAKSMYLKGRAFLEAYFCLTNDNNCEAREYVRLYLLCQSIEVILKGLLLTADYDRYNPLLKHNRKNNASLGHNLVKTAVASHDAFGLTPIRVDLKDQLEKLTKFYDGNMLRYGHIAVLFIAPSSIGQQLLMRRIVKIIHVADRRLVSPQNPHPKKT